MSRRILALASAFLAVSLCASPAEAQLGGLAKKARQKAAEATGVQSTDQPARMAGPEVTPASVDRLLLGLKAEATAMEQRAAAERRRQQQEEAARNAEAAARDASARRQQCYEDKQKSDPAAPELQRLQEQAKEAADKGDYTKASQLSQRLAILAQAMSARVQAACGGVSQPAAPPPAPQPTPEQQAMRQGGGSPSDAGANAAGMSASDYAQFKELVYIYLTRGNQAGLPPNERQPIDNKRQELRDRLKAVGLE